MVYSPQRMNRVLRPLEFFYQVGSQINNFLFDHKLRKINRVSSPVISVGNLAFGGSEKTPLVMRLLSFFKDQELSPALITRGYKGSWEKSGGILSDGKSAYGTWQEVGDEPYMVWRNFPSVGIFIGRNRLISCEKAVQAGFSPLILDDGFQHRQLCRDRDIILFDPDKKIVRREPVSSIRRADIILVKKKNSLSAPALQKYLSSGGKIFTYSVINRGFFVYPDESRVQKDTLKGKRFLAVCGIARPERFFSLLEEEGLRPMLRLVFPDHHTYPPASKMKIIGAIRRMDADGLFTTEKDVFKLGELDMDKPIPVYYNKIDLQIEDSFYQELLSLKKDG